VGGRPIATEGEGEGRGRKGRQGERVGVEKGKEEKGETGGFVVILVVYK
jgi:hypothetical protein